MTNVFFWALNISEEIFVATKQALHCTECLLYVFLLMLDSLPFYGIVFEYFIRFQP